MVDSELFHRNLNQLLKNRDTESIQQILVGRNFFISTAIAKEALNTENPVIIQVMFDNVNHQSLDRLEIFDHIAKIQSVPAMLGVLRSKPFQNPTNDMGTIYRSFIRYVFDPKILLIIIDLLLANKYPLPTLKDIYYVYLKNWDDIFDRILMSPGLDITRLDSYLEQELENYPSGLIIQRFNVLKKQSKNDLKILEGYYQLNNL